MGHYGFNSIFQTFFARIDKIFFLEEDWAISNSIKFYDFLYVS